MDNPLPAKPTPAVIGAAGPVAGATVNVKADPMLSQSPVTLLHLDMSDKRFVIHSSLAYLLPHAFNSGILDLERSNNSSFLGSNIFFDNSIACESKSFGR